MKEDEIIKQTQTPDRTNKLVNEYIQKISMVKKLYDATRLRDTKKNNNVNTQNQQNVHQKNNNNRKYK